MGLEGVLLGARYSAQSLACRTRGRVWGLGFGVQDLGFRIQGLGFRVHVAMKLDHENRRVGKASVAVLKIPTFVSVTRTVLAAKIKTWTSGAGFPP